MNIQQQGNSLTTLITCCWNEGASAFGELEHIIKFLSKLERQMRTVYKVVLAELVHEYELSGPQELAGAAIVSVRGPSAITRHRRPPCKKPTPGGGGGMGLRAL